MKKMVLILLIAVFMSGCDKYEPLHFPRTPYEGNELRTDGFWYHVKHSGMSDRMTVYFMYRDGTLLMAAAPRTTNLCEITADDILCQSYNNQTDWGVFVVENDTLKWSEWFWPNPAPGIAVLTTFEIVNDTCIKRTRDEDYYYFYPFDYKPDSTYARQWIP